MRKLILFVLLLTPATVVWEIAEVNANSIPGEVPGPAGQTRQAPSPQIAPQDGIEIQARGQVHEAFATPAEQRQMPTPIIRKQPPEPVNELPPDQKPEGDNIQWIPGYWMWDDDRSDFLWVSGTWRAIPPEKRWLPGYWMQANGGSRWVSGYWVDDTETHVTLYPEPPAPIEEATPVINEATQTYIPGIWVNRDNRYWWRPGFAINNQPGWTWTPASYRWTPGGYAFADGYWDYELNRRGLVFAPVYFDPRFSGRPNWSYQPRYVVNTDFMLGSLFVNTGWNHYFFGDYYDRSYAQRGYSPWANNRGANRQYDPLFSYYRWQNRGDQRWERELVSGYIARRDGSIARPGRTLSQLESTRSSQTLTKSNGVVSLDKWQGDQFKLNRLTAGEDRKIVEQYKNLRTERYKNENATVKRMSMYPRDRDAGNNKTERQTESERKQEMKTPPAERKESLPPAKLPPGKQSIPLADKKDPLKGGKETPEKDDTTRPGNRYELPKNTQTYRPNPGKGGPPERPKQPQPVQNSPRKGSDNPGKK